MPTAGTKPLISLPEAAGRLGVSYRRAYDLLLLGKLGPSERRGGRIFVSPEVVAAYVGAERAPAAVGGGR